MFDDATPPDFLARLARLPIRDWLVMRDAGDGGQVGRELFPACVAALDAAREQVRTREVRALVDDVRRIAAAIAWFAEFQPDGKAITRQDVAALDILAEWAAVALLMRDALSDAQWRALYWPFSRVLPHDREAGPGL